MSTITAETIELMEMLPQSAQRLAPDFVKEIVSAWRMEYEIPNSETIEALEEAKDMLNHPEQYKSYTTFQAFMDEMSLEP